MIGIAIGIIVCIVVFVLVKKDPYLSRCMRVLLSILMAVMLVVVVDGLAFAIFDQNAVETTEATEVVAAKEIIALQDNSLTTGRFFLGSGSVNNKSYYAFYYASQNGYKYMTLDAESVSNPVYIKYIASGAEAPHIDRYAIVERKTLTSDINPIWFSLIAWFEYGKYSAGDIISEEITSPALFAPSDEPNYFDNFRYEIFIPEGSIKQGYAIDLE